MIKNATLSDRFSPDRVVRLNEPDRQGGDFRDNLEVLIENQGSNLDADQYPARVLTSTRGRFTVTCSLCQPPS